MRALIIALAITLTATPVFAARHSHKAEKAYTGDSFSGRASFYHEPQPLATGGRYNPYGITAAHRTLPFGTRVKVTNKRNGRSTVVTINDRGPAVWTGKIIDLSLGAAQEIGLTFKQGWTDISADILSYGQGRKRKKS
jgi:rare lipoprotein A